MLNIENKIVVKTDSASKILNKPQTEVYLILDNIRSILNVGAIFRTADAAGIKRIYLCGITAYPSKKDIKYYDHIEVNDPISITDEGDPVISYIPSDECIRETLLPRISKTGLLATNIVDWSYKASTREAIIELKDMGVQVVALEQSEQSIDYRNFDYKTPIAIVLGNEVSGVSPKTLLLCDHVVEIEIHGACKSLNVATAAGIILFKAIEKHY